MAKCIPIDDGVLEFDCLCAGEVYVLVIINSLHVPSICHNLIPPFIMRAGGIIINGVPKTRCKDLIFDNHSVSFDQSNMWIPLRLNGELSHFQTKVPTKIELHECEKLFLNPDSSDWNPYCQSYERDEKSMLQFEGNMHEPYRRSMHQVVFEGKDDDMNELASNIDSATASDWETNIDDNASASFTTSLSFEHYSSPISNNAFLML